MRPKQALVGLAFFVVAAGTGAATIPPESLADVASSEAQACDDLSAEDKKNFADALGALKDLELVAAQDSLAKLAGSAPNSVCRNTSLALANAALLSARKEYVPALDNIMSIKKNSISSIENESDWLAYQSAKLKVAASEAGVKLRRKYKLKKEERVVLDYQAFLDGAFTFENRVSHNKLASALGVVVRTGSQPFMQPEMLIDEKRWAELAVTIMRKSDKPGLDVDYLYLSLAARALGKLDAALVYANKAVEVHNKRDVYRCGAWVSKSQGRRFNYCGRYKLPQAAQSYVDSVRKAEADKARRLVEEKARAERMARQKEAARKKAAAQAAAKAERIESLSRQYPEEWVQAILNNKVLVGMNEAAVVDALGQPNSKENLGGDVLWTYGELSIIFSASKVSFIGN